MQRACNTGWQPDEARHKWLGVHDFRGCPVLVIEREDGGVALNQLEHIGALVPADVQICCRFARQRADGQEGRAFRVSELELPRRLSVSGHAHGINRRDRTRKADGGDPIRCDGHSDNDALVERDAQNGFRWIGQREGDTQQEETNL